jgi:hypothetical protein
MEDKVKGKVLTIKIKDQEIQNKCKILYRMNGVIIETLLKLLFERVDVTDILKAYVENEAEGVRELIIKVFKQFEEKKQQDFDLLEALENEEEIIV